MSEPNLTPKVATHGAMRLTIAYEPADPRKFQDAIMILAAMLKGTKPREKLADQGENPEGRT